MNRLFGRHWVLSTCRRCRFVLFFSQFREEKEDNGRSLFDVERSTVRGAAVEEEQRGIHTQAFV